MHWTRSEEQYVCPTLHMEFCTQVEACNKKLVLRELGTVTAS